MIMLVGGALHRVDTYLIAFDPGANYHYFPSVPELLITFGIIAAEVAIYIAVVKTFPILRGHGPGPARSKA
jgi:Ni/Fe-hydrogenase subunit HybB-like protein